MDIIQLSNVCLKTQNSVCIKLDIDCLTRVHNLINQIRFYFVTLG